MERDFYKETKDALKTAILDNIAGLEVDGFAIVLDALTEIAEVAAKAEREERGDEEEVLKYQRVEGILRGAWHQVRDIS